MKSSTCFGFSSPALRSFLLCFLSLRILHSFFVDNLEGLAVGGQEKVNGFLSFGNLELVLQKQDSVIVIQSWLDYSLIGTIIRSHVLISCIP